VLRVLILRCILPTVRLQHEACSQVMAGDYSGQCRLEYSANIVQETVVFTGKVTSTGLWSDLCFYVVHLLNTCQLDSCRQSVPVDYADIARFSTAWGSTN